MRKSVPFAVFRSKFGVEREASFRIENKKIREIYGTILLCGLLILFLHTPYLVVEVMDLEELVGK